MFAKKAPFIASLLMIVSFIIMPMKSDASGIPFDIKPVLPSNQDPDVTSYISINAESSKNINQELEFVLKNHKDVEQTVEINVVDAYTSPNGVVQYVEEEMDNTEIIDDRYKMTNYLKLDGENKIVLKPNEEKTIKTKLDVGGLEGVLLGGVTFKTVEEGEIIEQDKSTFQIDNEIKMVIGVKVDFGTERNVEIEIGEPFVDPMPAYYAVRLPVTLNAPLLKKLDLDYQIIKDGETLFEGEGEYDFAPMTKTELSLAWEHEKIEEKTPYVLKGTLSYKDVDGEEKTLDFEKEFVFEGDEQDGSLKTLTVPIIEKDVSILPFVLILVIVLLGVLFIRHNKSMFAFSKEEVAMVNETSENPSGDDETKLEENDDKRKQGGENAHSEGIDNQQEQDDKNAHS